MEVTARSADGVFHPKVWVLRFASQGSPVLYRLMCLTRNLTFDCSWDTALVLEGEVAERKNAFGSNHPLGDFLGALPRLSLRPVSERVRAHVELVQEEIRKVRFQPPEGFEAVAFWPLGIGNAKRWPFEGGIDRMLVVSPFLSEGLLARLTQPGSRHVLISRLESLREVSPERVARFASVFTLSDAADPEPAEGDGPEGAGSPEAELALSGLHAKLYVAESGSDSRLWTGSANATYAAFNDNVEFLVELRGKKNACGIGAILGDGGDRRGLLGLLEPFQAGVEAVQPDPVVTLLDRRVQASRQALYSAGLAAWVVASGEQGFHLEVRTQSGVLPSLPQGVTAACWPVTLRQEVGVALEVGGRDCMDFGVVSMEALTSFFAFEVKATEGDRSTSSRFVLNLPLIGAPEGRNPEILRSLLKDKRELLRFLLLVLSDSSDRTEGVGIDVERVGVALGSERSAPELAFPLFESLVKALDRSPEKLDQIDRLIRDLGEAAPSLLPDGFEQVWAPTWEARGGLVT